MPRGFAENLPAAAWLRFNSFTVSTNYSDKEALAPSLIDKVMKGFALILPLCRWLNGALGHRRQPPCVPDQSDRSARTANHALDPPRWIERGLCDHLDICGRDGMDPLIVAGDVIHRITAHPGVGEVAHDGGCRFATDGIVPNRKGLGLLQLTFGDRFGTEPRELAEKSRPSGFGFLRRGRDVAKECARVTAQDRRDHHGIGERLPVAQFLEEPAAEPARHSGEQ